METPLQIIAGAREAWKTASGIFDDVYGRVERTRARKLDTDALLRAFYLEVVSNLELLSVIDIAAFRDIDPGSPLVAALLSRIDIDIASAILFQENPATAPTGTVKAAQTPTSASTPEGLYVFLEKNGKVSNQDSLLVRVKGGKEERVEGPSIYENILQAVSFIVIKVEILKRVSSLTEEEGAMLHPLAIDRRIVNIRQRLFMIKDRLETLKPIKAMAR